jgi:hypothetical protein
MCSLPWIWRVSASMNSASRGNLIAPWKKRERNLATFASARSDKRLQMMWYCFIWAWPLGARVLTRVGRSVVPDSSMSTMVRPSARPSFSVGQRLFFRCRMAASSRWVARRVWRRLEKSRLRSTHHICVVLCTHANCTSTRAPPRAPGSAAPSGPAGHRAINQQLRQLHSPGFGRPARRLAPLLLRILG